MWKLWGPTVRAAHKFSGLQSQMASTPVCLRFRVTLFRYSSHFSNLNLAKLRCNFLHSRRSMSMKYRFIPISLANVVHSELTLNIRQAVGIARAVLSNLSYMALCSIPLVHFKPISWVFCAQFRHICVSCDLCHN